jgi:hypothetical protein
MKSTIELRVRLPIADIMEALADDIAREVDRQVRPYRAVMPEFAAVERQISPVATLEWAVDGVIAAVTRLENSQHTRDEAPAIGALHKAALALRAARRQLQRENSHA